MRLLLVSTLSLLVVACPGCGAEPSEEPAPPEQLRDCRVPIFYRAQTSLSAAPRIIGSFHGWKTSQGVEMERADDGLYRHLLKLPPGRHSYYIEVNGQQLLDAHNPLTLYPQSAEQERSTLYVQDCDVPALEATSTTVTAREVMAQLSFKRARSGRPIASVSASFRDGARVERVSFDASAGLITLRHEGLASGKHHVMVSAKDADGVEAEPITLSFWVGPGGFEWSESIIYQIMIDRFASEEGPLKQEPNISFFHGGQLQGITHKIEEGYFEDLGVNTLWLSPVYENPTGVFTGRDGFPAQAYHGYWPKAPRAVDARIGGEEALDALIAAAHERGIRVIVDIVLNHVHQEHPYAKNDDPIRWFNQPDGMCICGITCAWNLHMEDCWFDPFMPDLQLRNPQVMDQLVDDAVWWIDRFDLDGLRLDAVPMMPRLVMRHLRHHVRERFERGGQPVYLLGETFTHKKEQGIIRYFLGPHTLSGQFDFPVMWSLRDALAGRVPMRALDEEVRLSQEAWEGSGAVMAPILGNHDVPRFISDINDDTVYSPRRVQPAAPDDARSYRLLMAAWSFIFSQPGAPVIYYGDELGMPGANDPDNRRDMRFDGLIAREQEVYEVVKRLARARACSSALRFGERATLLAELSTYAQVRDVGDGYPAINVLNRSDAPQQVSLMLPAALNVNDDAMFRDVAKMDSALEVKRQGRVLELTMPAHSGALLISDQGCAQ